MSLLDRFSFSRSLAVLSELQALLSCNTCGSSLSGGASFSGNCRHQLCSSCLSSHPDGVCPVPQCEEVAYTKDYKPSTQTAEAALAAENIQRLLGGRRGPADENEGLKLTLKNNQYGKENEAGKGEKVVIEDLCQSNQDVDLPERREGERIGGSERSRIARKLGSCKEDTCEDGTTSDETGVGKIFSTGKRTITREHKKNIEDRASETEATTSLQMSEAPSKKGGTVRTENNQEAVELGEVREVNATVEAVEEPLQDLLLAEEEVMELGEVTTMGGQMEMEGKMTEAEGELQDAGLELKKAEEGTPISSIEVEVGMEDQMKKVRCENMEFSKVEELKDNLIEDRSYIINEALNAVDEVGEVKEVADENFNIVKNVVKQCFVRLPRLSKFLWVGLIVEKVQVGKRRPGHGPRSAVWVKKIRGLKSGHSKGSWKVIDAGS